MTSAFQGGGHEGSKGGGGGRGGGEAQNEGRCEQERGAEDLA